jgi:nitroimidazol reductase NimA-like FMN-containing flavoprotein (pyridoxamine 5'-phosphate oxidase superfamily)
MVEGTKFLPELSGEEMLQMLKTERVGRIGLNDELQPYVVPTDFAYGDGAIYIHSPRGGHKTELALKGGHVCFEIDHFNEEVTDYRSVIIRGPIHEVKDNAEKARAMRILAEKAKASGDHTQHTHGTSSPSAGISIFKIDITEMTGVKSPNGGHP